MVNEPKESAEASYELKAKALFPISRDGTILVVDDNTELANSLVSSLSDLGYSAHAAYTGREGLKEFESKDFNLVITDLNLPDIDGLELLKEIKIRKRLTVAIVITGYGSVESAIKAMKNGAYDFISKPIRMDELELVIERALEKHFLSKRLSSLRGLITILCISIPLAFMIGIVFALLWTM